ncbi:hypothetical protein Tco_1330387 [Tanacetum coccineum]
MLVCDGPSIKFDSSEANLMLSYDESTSEVGLSAFPSEKLQENMMVFNPKGLIKRDKVEKVKALGANGVMSASRVRVVWMEVGSGIIRARVVSRVVLGLVMRVVLVMLRGWEAFVRWFWMGELSLEEMSM